MTETTTEQAAVTPDSATGGDTAGNVSGGGNADKMVPYGSLHEERQKRKAAETQLEQMASEVLSQVPEDFRGLIPESLPPLERVAWFKSAKSTGIFDQAAPMPGVPLTDAGQPRLSAPAIDKSKLSPTERMKMGYN